MRWGRTQYELFEAGRKWRDWHAWFAWHPVRANRWVWLEWVERKPHFFWDQFWYVYRDVPKETV